MVKLVNKFLVGRKEQQAQQKEKFDMLVAG
jgi:hypothetical protein